ncbi:DUF5681 domain-containing protein [Acidocella sp.]|uniref:DUF5681 domain-containing protein n=1 Tax=Acidocella sp. TaxID=50710 RepID=UPI0017990AE3|nr:DUF5681 domain-containing protein [Acidocella sp.]NNM55852.1 hypothetical protein [Acidocella sp.]
MTGEPENSAPKQDGRFKPGQSGNPAGKPRGSRHRVTMLAEKLMSDDAEAIVKAVLDAAQKGDMSAARLVLDRIAPARKGSVVMLDLPPVSDAAGVTQALAAVVQAMAAGEIAPDEAQAVSAVLEGQRRAIETVELERRIAELENRK